MTLSFSTMQDAEVSATLRRHRIGLTVEEARKIGSFLKRDPTLVEAVIWGIQGSEHCSYKSSRRFLKTFPKEGKHVILGPVEDSGIIAMTDGPPGKRWGFVISHESHNHPSQIVPFEGAATGVGGCVRDVVCMGARVIGCMDMLRLGDLKTDETKTIAKEVMRGIAGYGNPLGIPNLGGDTYFDATYNMNCLVNAITFGIVREDEIIHSYAPEEAGRIGYDILIVGKPTDRSGFGGAAFSSIPMEEEKKEQNTGAVQEPNPFLERHLLASMYSLFDWLAKEGELTRISCKDLGAGGVVCASVEQVANRGMGAEIDLGNVHVAIDGLPPEVIACAETQERLCFICHPDLTERILRHYNETWDLPNITENARASVIGKVTDDGIYHLTCRGETVCEARAADITSGLSYERPTKAVPFLKAEPSIADENPRTITDVFHAMLKHPNHASKNPVFLHYDKNVIGNTWIEPGEADAGVVIPLQDLASYVHEDEHPDWENLPESDLFTGIAIAADGNPRYGRISPYWQGANATVEAMRNVAAVGARPRALTDCLNYGNPEIPEQLWALEEGVRGIADAARGVAFDGEAIPVISGNVSLYNSRPDGSAIDPTAIVGCVGVLKDARKAITMQVKQPGSVLLFVGERKDECGGSAYYQILEKLSGAERDTFLGKNVPQPKFSEAAREMNLVIRSIEEGYAMSCHDISDGGLLLALFEMTLPQRREGGTIGMEVDLSLFEEKLRPDVLLYSESGGFLIEVTEENEKTVKQIAHELTVPVKRIGKTVAEPTLTIRSGKSLLLAEPLDQLRKLWSCGLEIAWKNT